MSNGLYYWVANKPTLIQGSALSLYYSQPYITDQQLMEYARQLVAGEPRDILAMRLINRNLKLDLMIERAIKELDLDPSLRFNIGDYLLINGIYWPERIEQFCAHKGKLYAVMSHGDWYEVDTLEAKATQADLLTHARQVIKVNNMDQIALIVGRIDEESPLGVAYSVAIVEKYGSKPHG